MPDFNITQSKTIVGLGTWTHTTAFTDIYTVKVSCTEIPPSGITIAIKQGVTTIATSTVPADSQGHIEIQTRINATAADVISVVLASSSAIDNQLNTVKTLLNVYRGQ